MIIRYLLLSCLVALKFDDVAEFMFIVMLMFSYIGNGFPHTALPGNAGAAKEPRLTQQRQQQQQQPQQQQSLPQQQQRQQQQVQRPPNMSQKEFKKWRKQQKKEVQKQQIVSALQGRNKLLDSSSFVVIYVNSSHDMQLPLNYVIF